MSSSASPFSVAGIPFLHHGDPGVPLPRWITPMWAGSPVTDEPIHVYHALGDTSASNFQALLTTSLPHGEYYVDDTEKLAIRAHGAGAPIDRPQLLRTRESGRAYAISYEDLEDIPKLQWGWHRAIFMQALPLRRRGLLVHATGLVLPSGMGVICPGVSGAGKSTLAATVASAGIEGTMVLGDDRIAVTGEQDSLRIWGTPWHSSAGTAISGDAQAGAVVFMRRAEGASLAPITPASALHRILRTVAIPFWHRDGTEYALAMVERLVSELPCFEFAYAPSASAASMMVDQLEREVSSVK